MARQKRDTFNRAEVARRVGVSEATIWRLSQNTGFGPDFISSEGIPYFTESSVERIAEYLQRIKEYVCRYCGKSGTSPKGSCRIVCDDPGCQRLHTQTKSGRAHQAKTERKRTGQRARTRGNTGGGWTALVVKAVRTLPPSPNENWLSLKEAASQMDLSAAQIEDLGKREIVSTKRAQNPDGKARAKYAESHLKLAEKIWKEWKERKQTKQ